MEQDQKLSTPAPDPKSILESKTFWGLVIGLAIPILAKHGILVDQSGLASDVATAIGGLLALYGRFTADAPLTLKK